jgi:hypothetical protein
VEKLVELVAQCVDVPVAWVTWGLLLDDVLPLVHLYPFSCPLQAHLLGEKLVVELVCERDDHVQVAWELWGSLEPALVD